jgi:hypothetical protein
MNGSWLDLSRAHSRIDAPVAALIAVLQRHGVSLRQRDQILTELGGNVRITPELLERLTGSKKPVDEASVLYASGRRLNKSGRGSVQLRRDFVAALVEDRLQQHLFIQDNLRPNERAGGIYYDGNALVNAANRNVDDLANDPSLMSLPDFASLTQAARRRMVVDWLDAHGQDTQYLFGSFEHSMASVLKTAAMARGEAAPRPYASRKALGSAFAELTQHWPSRNSTLIDPKILFGLHLVKTHGIRLHGPASQRLEELKDCLSDLLTEAAGPPVFDRRAAALDMLAQETGLSKPELSRPRGQDQELNSLLDEFMHRAQHSMIVGFQNVHLPFSIHVRRPDGPASLVTLDPKALLQEAEARFREDLPHHPWFTARARLALRREDVPLTADTVAEEIGELVAQYQVSAQHPSKLRHWMDNMPVISNIIGFVEGIARGDVDEVISSIPVQGNIHNAVEGVFTGDGKRTATALITLVPYVGSGYIIEDGVASNDTAEVVGGAIGLGLDLVTAGEGHLAMRGRVAGHSALGEGKVASHIFSHHEVPAAVRMQAQHSLGALRDLGIDGRALSLMDKVGEHGSVGDPYGLLAASDDVAPLSPQMQQLLGRLAPVPEYQRPMAMRPSEGGTWQDPETLVHYARIGRELYRVAKDEAASTQGYAIWNPMDAYGNARERTIRLENRDGQWQEARDVPGLKGGAPEPVLRVMDTEAAKEVDMPVPRAYANANPDRRPGWNNGRLPVSETETVIEVRKFLSERARDVTRRKGFEQGFDQYFDVRALESDETSIPSAKTHKEVKTFFARLYDRSEMFRSLYNFAVDNSRLSPTRKWTLELGAEGLDGYMSVDEARKMRAPHVDTIMKLPVKFLSKEGGLVDLDPKGALMHEMTHLLTGLSDPDLSLWDHPFISGYDVNFVRKFGLGERGAVEYFTQRILREADIKVSQRQTYLAMTPEIKGHLEESNAANYADLDRYVSLQDEYLDALFPVMSKRKSGGCAMC